MDKSSEIKWLVVQIKPNSYDLALRNLERQGCETFLPKMKVTIKKENKFVNKDVLVFPGYIFVGIDLDESYWTKLNSTYGVSKLLSFNNKPSEISFDLIMALKKRYEDNINPTVNVDIKKGDIIKFKNGPFADLVASIESIDAESRIYALLKVMGGYRKLKINANKKINFIKS